MRHFGVEQRSTQEDLHGNTITQEDLHGSTVKLCLLKKKKKKRRKTKTKPLGTPKEGRSKKVKF